MQSKRTKLESLRRQLENERSSFLPHWRDLCDYILPRRGRFFLQDTNKGDRRNHKIIDSTATLAVRTLRSGMMTGITSPARTWFKLTTPDPDLADYSKVKEWLHIADTRMASVFLRSNIYQKLPILYGDMGVFGTGAISFLEDLESVVYSSSFPVGSYCLGVDRKGKVNMFSREFRMTVSQVVEEFGEYDGNGKSDWSNISSYVKEEYDRGNYHTWVDIIHMVYPNPDYDDSKPLSKNKKYASCHYELGNSNYSIIDDKFLRESGFDMFPVLAPRWEVTGEDTYGTDCPGMTALGDIRAIQAMHKRKSQAVDKMVNPPMIGPTAMAGFKSSILPGDITFFDEQGDKKFRPAHDVSLRLSEVREDIQEHQHRIKRSFFEDLFLMFAESDRRQITAREIDERSQEKLLAIGPVLEQLNSDLLDPMIDMTFKYMLDQNLLPPPPPELQGIDLKVEYVSIMAQAQKLAGAQGVERFTRFVNEVAQTNPSVLDKYNSDEAINVYGEIMSVPPKMIVPDDEAQATRAERNKAAQAEQQANNIASVAGAAKSLGDTDMSKKSALSQLLGTQTDSPF